MSSFCIWKSFSHFFSKNTCELDIVLTRTVNILTINELVKLTTLWTTGPWCLFISLYFFPFIFSLLFFFFSFCFQRLPHFRIFFQRVIFLLILPLDNSHPYLPTLVNTDVLKHEWTLHYMIPGCPHSLTYTQKPLYNTVQFLHGFKKVLAKKNV